MKGYYDGQTIVDMYVLALAEQPSITEKEIGDYITAWDYTEYTQANDATFTAAGIRFRMDTQIVDCPIDICQYVTVAPDGEMKFEETGQWFIISYDDRPLDTFAEALEMLRGFGWLE